ncbi:MAG TPA: hypothetical protein PKD59_07100 [Miltoncostaeaceae bacterium]|nr:hypothetical protein [Miltoncostaeaceae bacterium]
MAYCLVQDWVEPETERSTVNYDAISARLTPRTGDAKGFIAHAAGWTGDGFRIIEFWESKEDCDAFMRDHVMPTVMEVSGGPGRMPATTGYDLHNIVLR